ncbi:MAG: response regulator [Phascolarctobacterium sp.]|uniref:response regulator n=1 Tax=Phascolarctobacterium sp. TaxID=2049039 RepID=UPI0026DB0D89|nr:response regulator [Phascolarctobacterium sp.]MDO4921064.1 response regulator [Phascolarctobacterium sp.]
MINVLVVEDDPMVAQLHEHYLSQIKGYQLCGIASNGDMALKLLANNSYDLLILDIFMPTMDGLQLLAKIRDNAYDVDVIIVSAANDKDKIKQALRLGAVDYIIKPFEFERFNLALNNYLKRYHIVEDQNIIEQSDLDQTIIRQEDQVLVSLPKGLDKNTLGTVWECIRSIDGMFTTEEVAVKVGISRVSIRKYLEFLKSLHLLKLDLHRGSVGRPVYKYLCLDKHSDVLKAYIQ